MIDRTPWMVYDVQRPALHFDLPGSMHPLVRDETQTTIGVRLNPTAQVLTPAAGVLIIHHHNAGDDGASLITIDYRLPVNLYLPIIRR